jgi:hypothetical protein
MEKVTVSADALRKVLTALNGPTHHIRELQALRNPHFGSDNPINILCSEYNAAVDEHNATAVHNAGGNGPSGAQEVEKMETAIAANGRVDHNVGRLTPGKEQR